MAFPKFHGISMAAGSFIENLHVERLLADPTPVSAGRLWFNITDKVLRFSSLDAEGAVIVSDLPDAASINTAITDARAYTDDQITALKGVPASVLDTLEKISNALNNDPNVYNTLVTLMGDAVAAAKLELRGEVTESFDTLAELESGLNAEISNRVDAVTAEANTRSAADITLQENIDAEALARSSADTALGGRLDTLESQVGGAVGNTDDLTTTDKTSVVAAINEVNGALTDEVNARIAAVSDVEDAVNAEVLAREAADTAIRTDVNAKKFTFTAAAAALTHTVTHNLNASPLLVSVYVEGDDGKYRNDIVAVEETNANVLTISMTESRKVKVAVASLEAI